MSKWFYNNILQYISIINKMNKNRNMKKILIALSTWRIPYPKMRLLIKSVIRRKFRGPLDVAWLIWKNQDIATIYWDGPTSLVLNLHWTCIELYDEFVLYD